MTILDHDHPGEAPPGDGPRFASARRAVVWDEPQQKQLMPLGHMCTVKLGMDWMVSLTGAG
jgi:hypothetical protein